MELNFSESITNPEKYWEQNLENHQQPKKKKVSFDDILSNMNLVVNKSGVLQFMTPNQPIDQQYNQQYDEQYDQQYNQQYNQKNDQQIQIKKKQEPLNPLVKNSYIYNKYFTDYQDAIPSAPQIRVPKTMEEYKQMLLEDKIQKIQQQKRISEIKSTKLIFTSNPGNLYNPKNIQISRNNLQIMHFK